MCLEYQCKGRCLFTYMLFLFFIIVLQEKEIHRLPIRDSIKSMLAMGWSIDRTKDGESMSLQRENEKMRKISQASQVQFVHFLSHKYNFAFSLLSLCFSVTIARQNFVVDAEFFRDIFRSDMLVRAILGKKHLGDGEDLRLFSNLKSTSMKG